MQGRRFPLGRVGRRAYNGGRGIRAMKDAPVAALLLAVLAAAPILAASMTQLERQRLVAHLEMTTGWLADEVSGLSRAQLEFRPAPGTWSILDNLDHLVVSEAIYWQDFRRAMDAMPSSGKRSGSDESVLWYGIDRTQRQAAIPAELPKHEIRDARSGLETFRKLRAQMIEYARTTRDDLRAHVVPREASDAYQWLLLISTHSQRHILQIREVKTGPKYPKK